MSVDFQLYAHSSNIVYNFMSYDCIHHINSDNFKVESIKFWVKINRFPQFHRLDLPVLDSADCHIDNYLHISFQNKAVIAV